jgi:hypothetical protein
MTATKKKAKAAPSASPANTEMRIRTLLKPLKPASRKVNIYDPRLRDDTGRVFIIHTKQGDKLQVYVFSKQLMVEMPAKIGLLFTVNRKDTVYSTTDKLQDQTALPYKIYAHRRNDPSVAACLLLIRKYLLQLELGKKEGLFFYNGSINLLINSQRLLIPELRLLAKIRTLIVKHFPEEEQNIDQSKIPADLRDLAPLLKTWAIPDDAEREKKIRKLPSAKRQQLVDRVQPQISKIDRWLSSFRSRPMPYEAQLMGNLAELVTELKHNS